jgi:putative transposase
MSHGSAKPVSERSDGWAMARGTRGDEAGKKVNGRKRHIRVDPLGLLLAVLVHAADIPDREGAKVLRGACGAAWGGCA